MGGLRNTVVRRLGTRRARPWLVVLLVIVSLAAVASMPAAAQPAATGGTWPHCEWGCSANDVPNARSWLGDVSGNPLPETCSPAGTVTAYVWIEFQNNTGSDRYAYGVVGSLYIGDSTEPVEDFDVRCFDDEGDVIPGKHGGTAGVQQEMVYGPFTWNCGEKVTLKDVVMFWEVNEPRDPNTTCGSCTPYQPSQCEKAVEIVIEIPCDFQAAVDPPTAMLTCTQPNVVLEAEFPDPPEGVSAHYAWYLDDGLLEDSDSKTWTATAKGTYKVVVTLAECAAEASAVVDEDSAVPTVEITPGSLCGLTTPMTMTLTANVTGGSSPFTYEWHEDSSGGELIVSGDEAEAKEITVSQAGTYYVEVTGANGCKGTDDLLVPSALSVSILGEDDLTCAGNVVTLEADASGGTEPYGYQWYKVGDPDAPVGSNATYLPTGEGSYYVVVTDDNGCTAGSADDKVTVNDYRDVQVDLLGAEDLTCAKTKITLIADVTLKDEGAEEGDVEYAWYKGGVLIAGEDEDRLLVTAAGTYRVVVTHGTSTNEGCTAWDEETIRDLCSPTPPEPPCVRADVSAVIYGGWAGIPVEAWVGGTGQPTQYTAMDSSGRAAVLWTFYPPEGATWSVVVTPQVPAGLDPERWKYEPASKSVSIERCSEHQVTFQLIDTGPQVEVILPVTGGHLSWWQSLLRWVGGLLAH